MDHQGKKPILEINTQCSTFVTSLKAALISAGLSVVQSFDLRSVRLMHKGCTCPHHGTDQCTCELVVLLVYRSVGGPITLILDGRDGKTFVFVTENAGNSFRTPTMEAISTAIRDAVSTVPNEAVFTGNE